MYLLFYLRIYLLKDFSIPQMITKFDVQGAAGMHRGIPSSAQTA
jgi:hypothetical protein